MREMEKEMRQDKRPKVSICIPAYNNEAEVRRLLSSIAAQTMQDVEIILTDDSTNGEIEALVEEIRSGNGAEAYADMKAAACTENAAGVRWNAPCMSRLYTGYEITSYISEKL